MVDRSTQKAHDSLERRVLSGAGVAAGWDEHLGSAEALRQVFAVLRLALSQGLFQGGKVFVFLSPDVLRQVRHECLELGDVLGIVGAHVLEIFEQFFDLDLSQSIRVRI